MRILIVDGYNVIHSWPELRSALDRGGLEESRRLLTAALAEYAAVRGVEVTVVFDGPRTATASPAEVVDGVTVRFGGASGSADHVIERLAYRASQAGRASDVVVATSDRLQRDMVRAMGVPTIDARSLEQEVKGALSELGRDAERGREQARFARRLEEGLDPDVRARLEALRRGSAEVSRPPERMDK
ncbi:MAG TPA: NYN domain-containing protein [Candidatus Dormibacteraeota bacterium]